TSSSCTIRSASCSAGGGAASFFSRFTRSSALRRSPVSMGVLFSFFTIRSPYVPLRHPAFSDLMKDHVDVGGLLFSCQLHGRRSRVNPYPPLGREIEHAHPTFSTGAPVARATMAGQPFAGKGDPSSWTACERGLVGERSGIRSRGTPRIRLA